MTNHRAHQVLIDTHERKEEMREAFLSIAPAPVRQRPARSWPVALVLVVAVLSTLFICGA